MVVLSFRHKDRKLHGLPGPYLCDLPGAFDMGIGCACCGKCRDEHGKMKYGFHIQ